MAKRRFVRKYRARKNPHVGSSFESWLDEEGLRRDVNEWQIAGVKAAIASLDAGKAIGNKEVKDWVNSRGRTRERPAPKRAAR